MEIMDPNADAMMEYDGQDDDYFGEDLMDVELQLDDVKGHHSSPEIINQKSSKGVGYSSTGTIYRPRGHTNDSESGHKPYSSTRYLLLEIHQKWTIYCQIRILSLHRVIRFGIYMEKLVMNMVVLANLSLWLLKPDHQDERMNLELHTDGRELVAIGSSSDASGTLLLPFASG
ncbi:hypothetical protein DY000_02040535 [Brassica cretica]|uniref:Uncharacterized protein n=1 Tax=Brassica cretica TaxID=69181 RepID=A0ABQ7B618_BRACR|nr:hypothetical protein DY000_02040535 [Brassica cretica]